MVRETGANFIRTLVEDAISATTSSDLASASSKRNLIRTTYAAIEGIAWHLAGHVAATAKDIGQLTAAEELALTEKGYQVTRQGRVSEQTRYIPLPSLIRLAANIASRVDQTFRVDFNGIGWNRFLAGLEIRNRITHPKGSPDLEISEADIATTVGALHWILEVTEAALVTTVGALREQAIQIADITRKLEDGDMETWAEYIAAARHLSD